MNLYPKIWSQTVTISTKLVCGVPDAKTFSLPVDGMALPMYNLL